MAIEARELTLPQYGVSEGQRETQAPMIRGYQKHGNVSLYDSPYKFEVNVERFVELLQTEFNLPPEIIGKVEIHIVGEGKMSEIAATRKERRELFPFGNPMKTPLEKRLGDEDIYAVKNDEVGDDRLLIIFYPLLLWRDFNRDKRAILSHVRKRIREQRSALNSASQEESVSIAKKWEALDNQTELLSISKRMGRYLDNAPIDRVETFLNRLIAIKASRNLLRWVAHEADHIAKDEVEEKESLLNKKGFASRTINRLLYFLARYNNSVEKFLEGRANNAEERIEKKSQYADLIKFEITQIAA